MLDKAAISALIAKLSREQQELVKSLTKTSSPTDNSDYDAWLRIRTDLDNSKDRLRELLEKAQKNEPGNSKSECDAAQLALTETREAYRVLSVIRDVCQALSAFDDGFGVESYEKDANTLVDLRRILKNLGKEERCGLKVISVLKARRAEIQSALAAKVDLEWKSLIVIDDSGVRLTPDSVRLKDLIECAKRLETFPTLTKSLTESLYDQIILPLAEGRAQCTCGEQEKHTLKMMPQSSNQSTAVARVSQMRDLFIFLQDCLFTMDSPANSELASSMGAEINRKFAQEAVQRKCIEESLPANFAEFQSVQSAIVQQVNLLKQTLLQLNWISATSEHWEFSAGSLEELYASRCGRELLIKARRLFLSKHHFVEIKTIKSVKELSKEFEDDFCLFQLQPIAVSTTIIAVAEQSRGLLLWPTSEESLRCLISAVYNSFAMLVDVVPASFQNRLISVPLMGSLYVTSCLYASHQLGIFNRIVQKSPVVLRDTGTNWNICFLDLMLKLRSKAYSVLAATTESASREVLDVISNGQTAWLTKLAQNQLQNLLDQAILNRGLEILRRLADTWRGIFPPLVFQQTVGLVLDAVLRDAAGRVIAVEDINATDSTALCLNFRWLLGQAADLLKVGEATVESAPFKHVPSWMRFKEIIFVLDASMGQIAERWADHSGPLAEHLTPEELKKMVRALFENNDKRARLLAAIK